jgi:hypothetical protein
MTAAICIVCHRPCLFGQRDRFGRDAHYGCQMREMRLEMRDPRLPKFSTGKEPAEEGREINEQIS